MEGNIHQPANTGERASRTTLEVGQPFSDTDLEGAVKGMQDLLERKGVFGSTVEPQITRDEQHQEVAITFLLAVSAGLLARTLFHLTETNLGFSSDRLPGMDSHAPANDLQAEIPNTN